MSYRGKMRARLEFRVNDGSWHETVRELGQVPIMVRVRGPGGKYQLICFGRSKKSGKC